MLDRVGEPGEEELTELLKGFARLQVEEEKDSRIRHPLTSYGKEVLKESMREALVALEPMTPSDFGRCRADSQRCPKEERELAPACRWLWMRSTVRADQKARLPRVPDFVA